MIFVIIVIQHLMDFLT